MLPRAFIQWAKDEDYGMMEMTARQGLLYEITAETWEDRVAHFGDQEYGQPTQTLQLIHWRGGILQETWKRSGARDAVSSYRSLFVSSIAGKGAQSSGPSTGPVCANVLRWQKARGHCASILFLDSQSAYYIRELAVGNIEGDEAIAKIFQHFGLEPSDMHDFYVNIKQGGMMGEAGMNPVLRHLAKDMMFRSWFVTRHGSSDQVCTTGAGSRPGESWADLVYAFVLGRMLTVLHEVATAEDLLTPLEAKRQWFPRGAKAIHLKDVAADYVHLGGVIDPEVKLTQEVRRRLGQAKAAYDSGKKLIYSNATIPLPVRAALFRMSVSSTYYNLGLWVPTGPDGKRWKEASPGWCGTYTGHAFPRGMTSSRARRRPYTC
eukprot:s2048_g4.t2